MVLPQDLINQRSLVSEILEKNVSWSHCDLCSKFAKLAIKISRVSRFSEELVNTYKIKNYNNITYALDINCSNYIFIK